MLVRRILIGQGLPAEQAVLPDDRSSLFRFAHELILSCAEAVQLAEVGGWRSAQLRPNYSELDFRECAQRPKAHPPGRASGQGEIHIPWPSGHAHQRRDEHDAVEAMQRGGSRRAVFVIAELLCAGPGHEVKRFAVTVDNEEFISPSRSPKQCNTTFRSRHQPRRRDGIALGFVLQVHGPTFLFRRPEQPSAI